jgi:hypothetical protein
MTTKSTYDLLRESAAKPDWLPALIALHLAKVSVIKEHLKTGHPLIVWRDGKVYRQPPEDAKRELEQALKNESWASEVLQALQQL